MLFTMRWQIRRSKSRRSEGDIQVFKRNGVPCAFMWKMVEQKWEYVGEVVDPNSDQDSVAGGEDCD